MVTIQERIARGIYRTWELQSVLCDVQTKHQRVTIAKTSQGITLFCDCDRQSSEATQLVYHTCMTAPAMRCVHEGPVLVIGSSEGVAPTMFTEKFDRVVHVDIDIECVELCAKHLPYSPYRVEDGRLVTNRVSLVEADGANFVANNKEKWGIICLDLPEVQENDTSRIRTRQFLQECMDSLARGGVVISQIGSPALWRSDTTKLELEKFSSVFGIDRLLYYECSEHEWAWIIASRDLYTSELANNVLRCDNVDREQRRLIPPYHFDAWVQIPAPCRSYHSRSMP